MTCSKAPGPL